MRARTVAAIALGGVLLALCALAIGAAPPASSAAALSTGEETSPRALGAIGPSESLVPVAYFPIVFRQGFSAFSYADDFSDWGSGWPYGGSPFAYGYKHDEDKSDVYHIRMKNEGDLAFITGPSIVGGDFEYIASIRRATTDQPKFWYDEFGLLVSPDVIDPANPVGSGAYSFQIELRIDPTYDSKWVVSRWDALRRTKRVVLASAPEGTSITDAARIWNELKIVCERDPVLGDTMTFSMRTQKGTTGWTDWEEAYSFTKKGLPHTFVIGFYAYHSKDDLGAYTIEFQYDNVRTHSTP
ncbi:MAG: hypothetical protein JXA09_12760 [Anaerolineae bacterium]|nr:hypothetical protein [Anaerolineae bacterium]